MLIDIFLTIILGAAALAVIIFVIFLIYILIQTIRGEL